MRAPKSWAQDKRLWKEITRLLHRCGLTDSQIRKEVSTVRRDVDQQYRNLLLQRITKQITK